MLMDNLGDVIGLNMSVPDAFGIDDDRGSLFADIEAAGSLGAHLSGKASFGQLLFKQRDQLFRMAFFARPPRMA
jgi:hypothetical protein